MSLFQVVEKEGFGVDWSPVRYNEKVLQRFSTEEAALTAAKEYITDRNCNNALTPGEKLAQFEVFMMDKTGAYLGDLDGKPWYRQYPKDIKKVVNGEEVVVHAKGEIVKEMNWLLEGKGEVKVRTLPGT